MAIERAYHGREGDGRDDDTKDEGEDNGGNIEAAVASARRLEVVQQHAGQCDGSYVAAHCDGQQTPQIPVI